MIKLKIASIGKTKETWLEEALEEYAKRLSKVISLEWIWAKSRPQLVVLVAKDSHVICLDPKGALMTSEQFSAFLYEAIEKGGSRLTFVIGDADGLPDELRNRCPLLSLSPLTTTHQLTRLLLVEQVYRATEIARGSPYHK